MTDELEAMAEHARWLRMMETPPSDWPKDQPNPRFKDCDGCPERKAIPTEEMRRDLCRECPYEGLPFSVTERTLRAIDLADEPTEAIAGIVGTLGNTERRDLQAVRMWRASKMMGAGLG